MKNKNRKAVLAAALSLCLLGGNGVYAAENVVNMETTESAPAAEDAQTGEGTDDPAETMVKSYLTGMDVPQAIGRRRPVAVMLNNIREACPQSGIANAGVVYEATVEGDITRLMAVLEDYESLPRIGSVRSCRDYYLFYAKEFDAIYSHFGEAVYALQYFDQGVIDHLDGLEMEGTAYYRSTDRKAPHNAYTDFAHLQAGIQQKGFDQAYSQEYTGHYQFAPEGTETTLENGITANIVKLDNFKHNHPWFEYDGATKKYKRFQFEGPQIDENTQEQLTCDNIILQYSAYQPYDANGYLNIDTGSGGQGKFITRGKAIDIRWEKDSPWGITRYYDSENNEIQLNPGKTWVEIVLNDTIDSVTYQ